MFQKSNLFKTLPAIVIATFLAAVVIYAWTEPSSPPPGGNVSAPLNTSINAQAKEGALVIGTNSGLPTGLIVQYGNVGIGTTNPTTGKLVVSGGNIDVTGNKVINVAAPTASGDVATKGWVENFVGAAGGGSSWFSAGTYFLVGGVGNPAGADVYYCSKKVVDANGHIVDTAINPNQPCDAGDSSKKCYNGTCVTIVWLTYSGATHSEIECTGAGGTVCGPGVPGCDISSSGTLCRFTGSGVSCTGTWAPAGTWQRYSVATWGGDTCGQWISNGPTVFSNSIAYNYSGDYSCCCSASCAWGSSWHRGGCGDSVVTVTNPSTNRVEIGCK